MLFQALLLQQLQCVLEPRGDDFAAMVETPYGQVSVGHAVRTWLASEEAAPFAPKRVVVDGRWSARIRALSQTQH